MLYTYCLIASSPSALSLPSGFRGELQLIKQGAIAAIVEAELPLEELEENDQKLIQAVIHHDAVICEIFRQIPLLPLRFGTYFRTEKDLLEHLDFNAEKYQNKLQEIQDKVEFTLKLTPLPFSTENASPMEKKGKNYLKAKKQRYQEQTNYQNQQQAELNQLQTQINQDYPQFIHGEPKENIECFYLLIKERDRSGFSEQIEQWKKEFPTWTIEVSDPLPPYHFIE